MDSQNAHNFNILNELEYLALRNCTVSYETALLHMKEIADFTIR